MTIEEFVDNDEYLDSFQYRMDWNGYNVYEVWLKSCEYSCTGYPPICTRKGRRNTVVRIGRDNKNHGHISLHLRGRLDFRPHRKVEKCS